MAPFQGFHFVAISTATVFVFFKTFVISVSNSVFPRLPCVFSWREIAGDNNQQILTAEHFTQ